MSKTDRMRPISFGGLITRALNEYRADGSIFGVRGIYRHESGKTLPIFGETIETPFGPAAGPHTQLAQNIIAAYAGGSRFFELKTVQTLDGEDLPVSKPCILARDAGFNVEWSTELTVGEALNEYIKAWFALKLLSRELGLGGSRGFVFNMSVGYSLDGIKSKKIDGFIESLKDARQTEQFGACARWAIDNIGSFKNIDEAYIRSINPCICRSVTLSTLHGCPPDEIERIASYLIEEKKLNTYVKCNPTLLGYRFARETLDSMGYGDLSFDEHHFNDDLQLDDAVPMFRRLSERARSLGLEFGLKLSNTFPVEITHDELPGDEMYMSGRGLYPLTVNLAKLLERELEGAMRVSFSGGADMLNIGGLFDCGIWPITMATTVLKPGGYERMKPIAELLSSKSYNAFNGVDTDALSSLADAALDDERYMMPFKRLQTKEADKRAPVADCFLAPCSERCPIHQDISEYLDLAEKGEYAKALDVICRKNPLPFLTGTLCPHRCQADCMRKYYEEPIHIRDVKLLCAREGIGVFLPSLKPAARRGESVAIIGGGPAGMAAAFFAARAGASVTLFEKRDKLGGVPRYVIPKFRITDEAIDGDVSLLKRLGVDIRTGAKVQSAEELYKSGYTHVLIATGAWSPKPPRLEAGEGIDALEFLANVKRDAGAYGKARDIVVIGGGNTAMDAARAAVWLKSTRSVSLAYRRTTSEMPADEEELRLAYASGVNVMTLVSPASLRDGMLKLSIMKLGEKDASGRAAPVPTGAYLSVPCDLLIYATGTGIDEEYLARNGVALDGKGRPTQGRQSDRLWVIGDAQSGAATIVEAIASARAAVDEMLSLKVKADDIARSTTMSSINRGELRKCGDIAREDERCLHCGHICARCVEVCPNRANILIRVEGHDKPQVVHFDAMCNECGNCAAFCPHNGAPYRDKLTVYRDKEDLMNGRNEGFALLDGGRALVRVGNEIFEDDCDFTHTEAPYAELMRAARALAQELR